MTTSATLRLVAYVEDITTRQELERNKDRAFSPLNEFFTELKVR